MKQYKAVAGPKNVNVSKGDTQSAFNLFADLINRECASGWTYHSMETITVTESNGCANLFQAPIPTNYYMLIFERDI
jgi:hypothetical protein